MFGIFSFKKENKKESDFFLFSPSCQVVFLAFLYFFYFCLIVEGGKVFGIFSFKKENKKESDFFQIYICLSGGKNFLDFFFQIRK